VSFIEDLVQPERLRADIMLWAEEEMRIMALSAKSDTVVEEILYRGASRKKVVGVLDVSPRAALRIVLAFLDRGVVTSTSLHSPLCLAFPARLALRWIHGLFPEKPPEGAAR
jgi:hypothetical protein